MMNLLFTVKKEQKNTIHQKGFRVSRKGNRNGVPLSSLPSNSSLFLFYPKIAPKQSTFRCPKKNKRKPEEPPLPLASFLSFFFANQNGQLSLLLSCCCQPFSSLSSPHKIKMASPFNDLSRALLSAKQKDLT